jgi:Reverse transcriptase (RNA-dependent DNA polymerase)
VIEQAVGEQALTQPPPQQEDQAQVQGQQEAQLPPSKKGIPPRTVSMRRTKISSVPDVAKATPKMMSELKRIGTAILNPEASSLANKIRKAGSFVEEQSEEVIPGKVASSAFTLIDRFGGDIGSYAEVVYAAIKEVDPSKFKDMFENPKSYKEAWNHKDPFQREKWREAITKELTKMEEKKVWHKISQSQLEKDQRCVKLKWVLEIKRDGRFCARLLACGYNQIPGVDFNDVYSPVVNHITFRIAVILMTY